MIKRISFKRLKLLKLFKILKVLLTLFLQVYAGLVTASAVGDGAPVISKVVRNGVANDKGALELESIRGCQHFVFRIS